MLATKETLSHGYAILYLVFVIIISFFDIVWASLVAQMVKNPPAIQETWVPSLGWEDLLEQGMETYPSILVWRIPWTEEPDRQSMGSQREGHKIGRAHV